MKMKAGGGRRLEESFFLETKARLSDNDGRGMESRKNKKSTHTTPSARCADKDHIVSVGGRGKLSVIRESYKDAKRIDDSKNRTSSAQCL